MTEIGKLGRASLDGGVKAEVLLCASLSWDSSQ
jgi:hypothetical protein